MPLPKRSSWHGAIGDRARCLGDGRPCGEAEGLARDSCRAVGQPGLAGARPLDGRVPVGASTVGADEYERGVDHLDRLRVEVHAVSALELWERRHNLKVADAGYVALAERFSIPLVTSDARLTRAPGTTCEFRSFAVDRP